MDHSNPYTPPNAPVYVAQPGLASSTRRLLACLIASQLLVTFFSLPGGFELLKHGDIAPVALVGATLSTALLVVGGALLLVRRRAAVILLIAAVSGMLTSISWHPPFVITGLAISGAAAAAVLLAQRAKPSQT